MPKFRKKPVQIEAARWFKNGDHPADGPADREGRIVRYYRMPPVNEAGEVDVNGELTGQKRHCDLPDTRRPKCTATMHHHGWIDTIEGGHTVCPGDWIITGVQGEVYPCEPSIFEATYEPVEDAALSDAGERGRVMNRHEHKREAERLLAKAARVHPESMNLALLTPQQAAALIEAARVHALLAQGGDDD